MPNYVRSYVPGGTYFFTVVTFDRRPVFTDPAARKHLRAAVERVQGRHPFELLGIVLLPDHLHAVWALPPGDADYSTRWAGIKEAFTRANGGGGPVSASRRRHREQAVWQRRFWEHTVSDEDDLKRCLDYVHWNPVKHGLAARAADYPWSSFRRYVGLGEYPEGWGDVPPADIPGAEWE